MNTEKKIATFILNLDQKLGHLEVYNTIEWICEYKQIVPLV